MEPQPQEAPKKSLPKNYILIAIALITLVVCLGVLVIYLLFTNTNVLNTNSNNNNSDNDQLEDNDTVLSFAEEDTTYEWSGNALSATLPTDWTVVEYTTVEGMEMYAEQENMSFDGITGIEVYNESDALIFSVKGVSGIGGTGACSELSVFSDTPDSYIQSVTEENAYVGEAAPTIIDLSNSEYSDISFLGRTFRRVGNEMYVDVGSNAQTFETGCGISANFVIINQIAFSIMGEFTVTGNSYTFEIESNIVDEETLTKLDDVLNSFVAN